MGVEVRRASPGDAATIALLGRITFEETFGHLFTEHAADLASYLDDTFGVAKIERSLNKPSNLYWLATKDRLPAGYAKLKLDSRPPVEADGVFDQLQKIYVLRSFLSLKIGAALMAPLLAESRTRRSILWLDVLQDNVRAIDFYRRFGFGALGDDVYTIGAQTFRFHLMAMRPQ